MTISFLTCKDRMQGMDVCTTDASGIKLNCLQTLRASYVVWVPLVTGLLSIRTLALFFKVRKTLKLPVTIVSPG